MPNRTFTSLTVFLFFVAGFAWAFSRAVAGSGEDAGNLWLLTSLILGVGVIGATFAALASIVQARRRDQPGPSGVRHESDTRRRQPPHAHP